MFTVVNNFNMTQQYSIFIVSSLPVGTEAGSIDRSTVTIQNLQLTRCFLVHDSFQDII